jgi:CBS domain-containing protein
MRVSDLIHARQDVYSIEEETTVHDAARYLREHSVRSVGVLDKAGKLAGVVSHSDISDKVAAENKCPAWMRVSEIMTRDLLVVQPDASLDECLRLMETDGKARRLSPACRGAVRALSRHDFRRGPLASHRLRSQSSRRYVRSVCLPAEVECCSSRNEPKISALQKTKEGPPNPAAVCPILCAFCKGGVLIFS